MVGQLSTTSSCACVRFEKVGSTLAWRLPNRHLSAVWPPNRWPNMVGRWSRLGAAAPPDRRDSLPSVNFADAPSGRACDTPDGTTQGPGPDPVGRPWYRVPGTNDAAMRPPQYPAPRN